MKTLISIITALILSNFNAFAQANLVKSESPITASIDTEGVNPAIIWTTENEINITGFLVQQTSDGSHYFTIAQTKASGKAYRKSTYTVSIYDIDASVSSFRIVMVGMNGERIYSAPINRNQPEKVLTHTLPIAANN